MSLLFCYLLFFGVLGLNTLLAKEPAGFPVLCFGLGENEPELPRDLFKGALSGSKSGSSSIATGFCSLGTDCPMSFSISFKSGRSSEAQKEMEAPLAFALPVLPIR